jgi:hypothetical protein
VSTTMGLKGPSTERDTWPGPEAPSRLNGGGSVGYRVRPRNTTSLHRLDVTLQRRCVPHALLVSSRTLLGRASEHNADVIER